MPFLQCWGWGTKKHKVFLSSNKIPKATLSHRGEKTHPTQSKQHETKILLHLHFAAQKHTQINTPEAPSFWRGEGRLKHVSKFGELGTGA